MTSGAFSLRVNHLNGSLDVHAFGNGVAHGGELEKLLQFVLSGIALDFERSTDVLEG